MSEKKKLQTNCDLCGNYEYDDDVGAYVCSVSLDEDEMEQFLGGTFRHCPYYNPEGEYRTVRKQN